MNFNYILKAALDLGKPVRSPNILSDSRYVSERGNTWSDIEGTTYNIEYADMKRLGIDKKEILKKYSRYPIYALTLYYDHYMIYGKPPIVRLNIIQSSGLYINIQKIPTLRELSISLGGLSEGRYQYVRDIDNVNVEYLRLTNNVLLDDNSICNLHKLTKLRYFIVEHYSWPTYLNMNKYNFQYLHLSSSSIGTSYDILNISRGYIECMEFINMRGSLVMQFSKMQSTILTIHSSRYDVMGILDEMDLTRTRMIGLASNHDEVSRRYPNIMVVRRDSEPLPSIELDIYAVYLKMSVVYWLNGKQYRIA